MQCVASWLWLVSGVIAFAVASASEAQFAGVDAKVDHVPALVQNEISLTLLPGSTPGQPQVLLAAYNDSPYPGAGFGLGVSYSTDGGTNWTNIQLPLPTSSITMGPLVDAFDPTVTADTQGNLFVAHISTDGFIGSPSGVSGLYVSKSADQGQTWPTVVEVSADPGSLGPPDPLFRFNDRCQITADRFVASSHTDNVYIAWIKDRGWPLPSGTPYSDIYFSRSTDNGATFSPALQINDTGNDLGNMPVPRVAADGTVLVSWLDYNVWTGGTGTILLDKSTDGGLTWGTDQLVATISLPPLNVSTSGGIADALAKGAPVLATSPTNANELYIFYAASGAGSGDEADIYLIRSTNQGSTWSSALRVNTDTTTNDQILPWVDVKANGIIDAAWYDRRDDANDQLWNVYMTQSTDGGLSFLPEVRLNDTSFPTPLLSPSGGWMGEYLGLVVDSGYAYVMWASSVPDVNGDMYFDKLANPTLSPCGTAPETGCRAAGAGKSMLKIKNDSVDAKDQFKWAWNRGAATALGDFKDPVAGSATYRVCLYDSSGATQPLMEMDIPPGGTCDTQPCWNAKGTTGFKYKDKEATPDGVQKVVLKAGDAGRAKVLVKGKGTNLPTPSLSLTMPVTVQLVIDDGATTGCWQTTYTNTPIKNLSDQFKAKQ